MKKLLFFLFAVALCFAVASCVSVKDRTEQTFDKLYEYALDKDNEEFVDCLKEYGEWYDGLSYEDQLEAEAVSERWCERNPLQALVLLGAIAELVDESDYSWLNL